MLDMFSMDESNGKALDAVAMVSVVPSLTMQLRDACLDSLGLEPFIAGPGVRSGIRIRYDDPRSLGADRLVDLVAARHAYGAPALVLDFGTATTFNALNERGDFVGGAIAPGMQMSADALHQFTARLPLVEITPPSHALATNTRDALQAGIFYGYVAMVEGMITRLKREMNLPSAPVIATGGLAESVAPLCPAINHVDPNLPFEGLRLLYEMNRGRKNSNERQSQ